MKRKDKKYLNFIDSKPCLVCGGESTHHHVRTLGECGTGLKPPDSFSIPLCPAPCHLEAHLGEQAFYDKHFIDPAREIIKLLSEYIEISK